MNLNIDAVKDQTYDAIVIGSGITGGWASKELTEKGLRVLMLEKGHQLEHVTGYEYPPPPVQTRCRVLPFEDTFLMTCQ